MESVMKPPVAVVLAAGQGTRMKSDLPKVLCPVLGRPMIEYVLDVLAAAGVERVIAVVGYRADDVQEALRERKNVEYAMQTERLGTGHAVMTARGHLAEHDGPVLVLTGDSPLLQRQSVAALLDHYYGMRPACLLGTLRKDDPAGLGRIVRDEQGNFQAIVEEKDATLPQRQIKEVNMSTYIFENRELLHALDLLKNDNRQGEYYLTDCPGILKREEKLVQALPILQPCEALSINTVEELAAVEREMRRLGYQPAI
jgi:bifunctional UDP-N-acetylglucosamine pyrophosphorylase/glucosamine-1-phosphate N-acetyltransferase/UDP-N-acetylglucosamine pyrophosphorylase